MRRYLIIGVTILVAIGIGVGIYYFLFMSNAGVTATPGSTLPVAGNGTVPPATQPTGTASSPNVPASPVRASARLVRIDSGPVVPGEVAVDVKLLPDGTIATSTKAASTTPDVAIEYLERESGNIFTYLAGKGTLTRVSNRTFPGIEQATWLPDGSATLAQYLSGTDFSIINTYELPVDGNGGFFLPQGLAGVSTASSSILQLASGVNGSIATVEKADGSKTAQAFTTLLSMLRTSFAGLGYAAFTKPSSSLDGYAYLIDKSGHFSTIAGPLPGLTALTSPSGAWMLVSWVTNGSFNMELVNTKTHATTPLPVATIADKCAWTADESAIYCGIPVNPPDNYAYPDDWYQGAISFSDRIWKIDVTGRFAQLALDFSSQTNSPLDAEALTIDRANQQLVFVNKNDGSLWSFQL